MKKDSTPGFIPFRQPTLSASIPPAASAVRPPVSLICDFTHKLFYTQLVATIYFRKSLLFKENERHSVAQHTVTYVYAFSCPPAFLPAIEQTAEDIERISYYKLPVFRSAAGFSRSAASLSCSYRNRSRSYGNRSCSYGNRSRSYGNRSGSYGNLSGSYGSLSGSYGNLSGSYGSLSGSYRSVSRSIEYCSVATEIFPVATEIFPVATEIVPVATGIVHEYSPCFNLFTIKNDQ
jgi:hypothetical protein